MPLWGNLCHCVFENVKQLQVTTIAIWGKQSTLFQQYKGSWLGRLGCNFLSLRSGSSAFHHEMTLENRGKKVTVFVIFRVASTFYNKRF